MNDQTLGADPAQLRELATLFSTPSEQLERAIQLLHPAVLHAGWQGGDASRFRADWSGRLRPHMSRARDFLNTSAKALLAQAGEQEGASAADGGRGGGRGGGGGQGKAVPGGYPQDHPDPKAQLRLLRNASKEDVAAWWNGLSEQDRTRLLSGQDADKVPFAVQLAALDGKLPADAQKAANDALVENARASIPMYSSKGKFGIDGQVAWVHGGAHIGTDIIQNADGSARLKVSGAIGGGVNTPGTKGGVNAALTGELSRVYSFKSLAEAQAALNQMTQDLPPDSFGKAEDAANNPGGYLLGSLDHAAGAHGTVNHYARTAP